MVVKHFIKSENGTHVIWIQNHTQKREYFKSDDRALVDARMQEIADDIKKVGSRVDVLLALYRFAKDRGCIVVWKSRGAFTGTLKILPEGKEWLLVLARGRKEIILERKEDAAVIKEKYMNLMKKKANDPTLFSTIWDYAMTKQKLELRDVK